PEAANLGSALLKARKDVGRTYLGSDAERDETYWRAVELVVSQKQASISFIQRRLGIGYPKAARFIDLMEQDRIIGDGDGAQPRRILVVPDYLQRRLNSPTGSSRRAEEAGSVRSAVAGSSTPHAHVPTGKPRRFSAEVKADGRTAFANMIKSLQTGNPDGFV